MPAAKGSARTALGPITATMLTMLTMGIGHNKGAMNNHIGNFLWAVKSSRKVRPEKMNNNYILFRMVKASL
jgi:hypothetical protein